MNPVAKMLTCQQCGFDQWKPRKPNPVQCPRCHRYNWNEPKHVPLPPLTCKRCGGKWTPLVKKPVVCHLCGSRKWNEPKKLSRNNPKEK